MANIYDRAHRLWMEEQPGDPDFFKAACRTVKHYRQVRKNNLLAHLNKGNDCNDNILISMLF